MAYINKNLSFEHFIQDIRNLLDDIKFDLSQSGNQFIVRFPEENSGLRHTPYFFDEEKEFVHFTTLPALFSILNYRKIRLYNLLNSNDPLELKYGFSKLEIEPSIIDFLKEHAFTFSFCSLTESLNPKLWKKYGRNYRGVAITFKINNDISKWKNYIISRVYYNGDEFIQKFGDIKKAYKQNGYNINFNALGKIIGCFKTKKWMGEKEIRLYSFTPYTNLIEYDHYSFPELKIGKGNNRIVRYIELPLFVDNNSAQINSNLFSKNGVNKIQNDERLENGTIPSLQITCVRIGKNCGLNAQEYRTVQLQIEEMVRKNLGYNISLPLNMLGPNES